MINFDLKTIKIVQEPINFNVKLHILKQFDYKKVEINFQDKILYTSKNIPVLDVIFYFCDTYIFACSWKQTKEEETENIKLNLMFFIDLKFNTLQASKHYVRKEKEFFEKYLLPIQDIFETDYEKVTAYLNSNKEINKFFHFKLIQHFGHCVIDTLAGIDASIGICNKKAIICLPTPIYTEEELNKIFEDPVYIRYTPKINLTIKAVMLEVFKRNCLLFNVHLPGKMTFESIQKTSSNNTNKAVLVAKYDYRYPINQLDLFKELISILYTKKQTTTFVVVNYFNLFCGTNTVNTFFEKEHAQLINSLKEYCLDKKTITILDTYGMKITELKPVLQDSWCYVSPYGSMQHLMDLLCCSKIKICHGNKQLLTKEFNITPIPIECIKRILPPEGRALEMTTLMNRNHESVYELDMELTKDYLLSIFDET